MQRVFIVSNKLNPKMAIELFDIRYEHTGKKIIANTKERTDVPIPIEDVIIIDGDNEMSIFSEEYKII